MKNGHSFNMVLNEYEQTQNIDLNKIKCAKCNTTQYKTYNNEMFICL